MAQKTAEMPQVKNYPTIPTAPPPGPRQAHFGEQTQNSLGGWGIELSPTAPGGIFGPPASANTNNIGQYRYSPETVAQTMAYAYGLGDGVIPEHILASWDDILSDPNNYDQLPVIQGEIEKYIRSNEENTRYQEELDRAEKYRADAMAGVDRLNAQFIPELNKDVTRFDGGTGRLKDNFIFTDPTYATALSAADQQINAGIQQAMNNAALQTQASGAGVSGKVTGDLSSAESAGAIGKAGIRSNLVNAATGEFEGAKGRRRDFTSNVEATKRGIDSGYIPTFQDIQSMIAGRSLVDPTTPYATQADQFLAGEGVKLNRDALSSSTLLGLAGIGQEGFNNTLGTVSDFIPKVGKFLV